MRTIVVFCLLLSAAAAQTEAVASAATPEPKIAEAKQLTIPSGTKVPIVLKQAISTKSAREGDPVYAETNFPVVQDQRILIPAGTYVQGRISRVQRAGRIKGRAEMLMHFSTLIFPNGYTVLLPGALESVPGAEKTKMKGKEGTIQQEGQKGADAGKIATASTVGAQGGALAGAIGSGTTRGTLIGAGTGAALGAAIALFARGSDVRLEVGTGVEMVIQRDVPLDASRMPAPPK
ncbi:MAG TPA: hypothetical protein VH744_05655 [Terriglobales bacterium]